MFDDTEVVAAVASICGEPTDEVHVRLVDAHGHDRELTLDVDGAVELAAQLAEATA